MSERQTFKGKLKVVCILPGESLEDTCRQICIFNGREELPNYYNNYYEFIQDDFDNYVVANNTLYEVVIKEEKEYDNIFEASRNKDGTISYLVQYYNGGCGFSEAIEEALKKLD